MRLANYLLIAGLIIILVFSLVSIADNNENEITITVDGEKLDPDVPPIIEEERSLVEMRSIFEALGAKVEWDGETRTVTATKGDKEIELVIGDTTAYVSGEPVTLDVAPKIKTPENRTIVPGRFVSESMGANVHWDGATRSVIISTPEEETYTVTFEVEDHAGNRLEDVTIMLNGIELMTDEDGTAVVELESGAYDFRAEKEGYFPVESGLEVEDEDLTKPVLLEERGAWLFDAYATNLYCHEDLDVEIGVTLEKGLMSEDAIRIDMSDPSDKGVVFDGDVDDIEVYPEGSLSIEPTITPEGPIILYEPYEYIDDSTTVQFTFDGDKLRCKDEEAWKESPHNIIFERTDSGVTDTAELDVINKEITLPFEIEDWVEYSRTTWVAQDREYEGSLYLLATYGMKPTSGYHVEITQIIEEEDEIVVTVDFTEPAEDEPVLQVLTYPYDIKIIEATDKPVSFEATGAEAYVPTLIGIDYLKPIAAESEGIKVFSPAPESSVPEKFTVEGVANVFEGTVHYRLLDSEEKELDSGITSGSMGDWGYFDPELTVPEEVEAGEELLLELYTESPVDGSIENLIEIELEKESEYELFL